MIWDTAGVDKYKSNIGIFYRKSIGALLVYDITNLKSFEKLPQLIEEVKNFAEPEILFFLVGNKLDLVNQNLK